MKRTLATVLVLFGTALVGFSAHAQGLGYIGAQVGGGTIAALAGGAVGTLIGGLTGVLLGLPIEVARSPAIKVYQSLEGKLYRLDSGSEREILDQRRDLADLVFAASGKYEGF